MQLFFWNIACGIWTNFENDPHVFIILDKLINFHSNTVVGK